ncbi:FtsX-like permease family protein [Myxococcus sp. CA033]|uniref:ABC transporter permease n=1 Tax=Myxococcus sp. CA033 TaxID=2741516 RepID=UPI00157AC50D|nr:FtsX-like permease family protein [Myxococcus sp. CA033]NTX36079.1 FtsX-like permease family protein [Myxococcus sp. CA033]
MLSLIQLALRNLFAHRERALLLLGIAAAASGVIVSVSSLSAGVAAAQREAITTFISGDLNVGGFFKVHPDSIAPVVGDAAKVRGVLAKSVPEGCSVRERGRSFALAGAGRRRTGSFLVGMDVVGERGALERFRVASGSLESLARPRTLAISTTLAERLQVKPGDIATLFAQPVGGGRRNALDVEVVAITEKAGLLGESAGLLVSNDTLRELDGYKPGSAGVLQLVCGDTPVDVDALGDTLRESLRGAGFDVLPATNESYAEKQMPLLREGWRGQRLDVSTWEDESSFLSFVTLGLAALAVLVSAVVLVLVVIGLFVALSVAVRERTREIGTLRAMGMHRRSLVALFLMEGLLLGLVGSTLGAVLASGLCVVLRGAVPLQGEISNLFFSGTLPLAPSLGLGLLSVVLVTIGAGLATIVPAARAASLTPRSAMEAL